MAIGNTALALEKPEALLKMKMATQLLAQTEGTMTGEGVCWHAAWRAGAFLQGARQTGDLAYLDAARTYFDALIAKLHTSPDGRKGWVGPYIYDPSAIADVHIGDAILLNPMLEFALFVRTELEAAQRAPYAAAVRAYIDLAQHISAKWIERGTWYENGHYGGYINWDHYLSAQNLAQFQRRLPSHGHSLSLPFNKQQSMAILHLRLHRLTGDGEHLRKARLIFQYTRSRLTHFEDAFTWNYWEPLYPGDVVSAEPPKLAHWVGTHPYRDYQQGEVSEFVEAYHNGLVFNRGDIARLVRTNLRMWNGDYEAPRWVNSDAAANRKADAAWRAPDPSERGYGRNAGTLWRALCEFDSTLARLGEVRAKNSDYERRGEGPVRQFEWPMPAATFLNMGCVLPAALKRGDRAFLVSKTRAPGNLHIVLTDRAGNDEIERLFSGEVSGGIDGLQGLTIRPWRADVAPGNYRVRWLFTRGEHTESRDYMIEIE